MLRELNLQASFPCASRTSFVEGLKTRNISHLSQRTFCRVSLLNLGWAFRCNQSMGQRKETCLHKSGPQKPLTALLSSLSDAHGLRQLQRKKPGPWPPKSIHLAEGNEGKLKSVAERVTPPLYRTNPCGMMDDSDLVGFWHWDPSTWRKYGNEGMGD